MVVKLKNNMSFEMREDILERWCGELKYKSIEDFIDNHTIEDGYKILCYSFVYKD